MGGGKEVQEGGNILIPVHVDVWQKLYNIVKFQLKINKLRHAKKKKKTNKPQDMIYSKRNMVSNTVITLMETDGY